jgi:uncharacterized protein YndB with AHSA1/START domain
MRIRHRTVIERPAAQVWSHVIRPDSFKRWNEKISSLDAIGEFRVGQPFTTHYEWRGKAVQCASIATEVQEDRVLELRHTALVGPGVPPDLQIRQRIALEPHGARTVVTKTRVDREPRHAVAPVGAHLVRHSVRRAHGTGSAQGALRSRGLPLTTVGRPGIIPAIR